MQDWRNVRNGVPIPVENYCDQPYVLKMPDGAWLMVVTTGAGKEGEKGQHVISARSFDCGKTWVDQADVETAQRPESSYAVLYQTKYGRVYCFYNYNADNRRYVLSDPGLYEDGKCSRVDSQGKFVFKYSDDYGKSWSDEWYEIPQRKFQVDLENPYQGQVLYFWNVGKPFSYQEGVFVPLYKIGGLNAQFMYKTEGVLLYCDNIHTQKDPALLHWSTYPDGEVGIRVPRTLSMVSEEHSFVTLSDGSIFCVFRTTAGHAYCTYSRDGGHSFEQPECMAYAEGRKMKHPRAANFIWKCENGKYLYWYHNHGGRSYDDRNPVWLCGAVEYRAPDGQRLKFSQPEILLYDEDPLIRMSYPDLIEQDGAYYFTETQKSVARLHQADCALVDGLWAQLENGVTAPRGSLLKDGGEMIEFASFICQDTARADGGAADVCGGFTLAFEGLLPDDECCELFSTMTYDGKGVCAKWDGCRLVFCMGDGRRTAAFAVERKPFSGGGRHRVVIVADAGPRIVRFIVDGKLCDGGEERQFGFGWFDRAMLHANGEKRIRIAPCVSKLEGYCVPLTTSQAVNW